VYDLSGKLITTQGEAGLIKYIFTITGITQTVTVLPYAVVMNVQTGIQYKFYKESGKVTFMNDTVICSTGGLQCL